MNVNKFYYKMIKLKIDFLFHVISKFINYDIICRVSLVQFSSCVEYINMYTFKENSTRLEIV